MRVIGDTLEEVCSQHKQKWGHGVPLPNPPPPACQVLTRNTIQEHRSTCGVQYGGCPI
jgi:hypothetical protein